jgi:hypothetical protein
MFTEWQPSHVSLEIVNGIEHTIIRARPGTPGLPVNGTVSANSAQDGGSTLPPQDTFTPGPVLDPDLPDFSGFANFSKSKLLAVRDSKDDSVDARVLLVDKKDGHVEAVDMDWGQTRMARDLEAVTPSAGHKGQFLAVEGSSFGEKKARLFELSVGKKGGKAEKTHLLPEFGQEIEGMVSLPGQEGHQTVLFAGRGGNGQQGRVYWGDLSDDGLTFSQQGLAGKAVQAPQVGDGQRDLAELSLDNKGNLWGAAAVDTGDDGPYSSSLYQVGTVTPDGASPFALKTGQSYKLDHIKAEALAMQGNGKFWIGADNEANGGRFESLVI